MENITQEEMANVVWANGFSTGTVNTATATTTTTTTNIGSDLLIGDGTWATIGTTTNIPSNVTSGSTLTWDGSSVAWSTFVEDATKEELMKVIKNTEIQIEIKGVMKKCKLADLLDTAYLKLKAL